MRRKEQLVSFLTCLNCLKEYHFSISQKFPVLKYLGFPWGMGKGRGWVSHGQRQLCVPTMPPLQEECQWGLLAWPGRP